MVVLLTYTISIYINIWGVGGGGGGGGGGEFNLGEGGEIPVQPPLYATLRSYIYYVLPLYSTGVS